MITTINSKKIIKHIIKAINSKNNKKGIYEC